MISWAHTELTPTLHLHLLYIITTHLLVTSRQQINLPWLQVHGSYHYSWWTSSQRNQQVSLEWPDTQCCASLKREQRGVAMPWSFSCWAVELSVSGLYSESQAYPSLIPPAQNKLCCWALKPIRSRGTDITIHRICPYVRNRPIRFQDGCHMLDIWGYKDW